MQQNKTRQLKYILGRHLFVLTFWEAAKINIKNDSVYTAQKGKNKFGTKNGFMHLTYL